jgi:hypothetical protein
MSCPPVSTTTPRPDGSTHPPLVRRLTVPTFRSPTPGMLAHRRTVLLLSPVSQRKLELRTRECGKKVPFGTRQCEVPSARDSLQDTYRAVSAMQAHAASLFLGPAFGAAKIERACERLPRSASQDFVPQTLVTLGSSFIMLYQENQNHVSPSLSPSLPHLSLCTHALGVRRT